MLSNRWGRIGTLVFAAPMLGVLSAGCPLPDPDPPPPPPPNPPQQLRAVATSPRTVHLTWLDNSSDEISFVVQRAPAQAGPWADVGSVAPNIAAFDDSTVRPDSSYFYRVEAVGAQASSPPSNIAFATTPAAAGSPPVAPSGLTATTTSASSIALSWVDNSMDETGFQLERALVASGPFAQIATLSANAVSFSDSGLAASTTYFYRVRATNTAGNSAYSVVASTTTQPAAAAPPAAPSGLMAAATASSVIALSWTDNATNETGFKIERGPAAGGPFTQVATATANATNYGDSGLAASTTYFYRVRATNAVGDSAYSAVASATTMPPVLTPPVAPSALAANATSSSTISLTWVDNATNESGFKLERATVAAGPFTQIATPGANATSFLDSGLSASTAYFYRVRASNTAGDSAYSNTATATTLPPCPVGGTRCVAGSPGSVETCTTAGWARSSCPSLKVCASNACRAVCDLTATPALPTLCAFAIGDGVNNGEWTYATSSLLSPPNTGGTITSTGGTAPISSSGTSWPYEWTISSQANAFASFKLNQFGTTPRTVTLWWKARRSGIITGYTNNYIVGAFNGATMIDSGVIGPVPYNWGVTGGTVGAPQNANFNYSGGWNGMMMSITGDGFGGAIDLLEVNWIKLTVQ